MQDSLIEKLNSGNKDKISTALYTILHDPQISKYLNEVIKHLNAKDIEIRLPATMVLAQTKDKSTITQLEKLLLDTNKKIKIEAALGLSKYKNKSCYPILKEVIEKDYPDHSIHKRAIEALGKFKDETLMPIFRIGVFHRRKASRIKSVEALAKINSKQSIAALEEALSKETDVRIENKIKNELMTLK